MKYIELTKGLRALVDDEDYEILSQWKWFAHSGGYAVRNAPMVAGVRYGILYMHRLITNAPQGTEVDHRNRNKLDNQRSNLRIVTTSENQCNRGQTLNKAIPYKGVRYDTERCKYRARIKVNGKEHHLGRYPTAEDAARAYDEAARRYFGEFARTNF